jgi:Cu/Zn superoxide dismutase
MIKQIALLFGALAVLLVAVGVYSWSDASSHPSAAGPDGDDARAVLKNAAEEQVGIVKFSQEDDGVHVKVTIDAPLITLRGLSRIPCPRHWYLYATRRRLTPPGYLGRWPLQGRRRAHTITAHNGDLPIILVNDDGAGRGIAEARFVTDRFDVADIVGRGLIVHKVADNYRNIPLGADARQYTPNTDTVTDSATATGFTAATGNAGSRMACGVIEAH